ncbi:hypothetical protein EJ07DRAFT_171809 [Lizonia empirigonia]|nr:hypothetical protein EJ07DRAFT_171809 [Lizonia empirigonia]
MSVEAPQPVVASEAAPTPVEFTPIAVAEVAGEKTIVPATEEPKVEEQPKVEGEAAAAAAPVEEKKEDEKVQEKVIEPIYSGALGYKAPGLKNAFRFAKKYFWFGEEPVPASSLGEYLRDEKPEVAHPVAAWSSQTGKGLLYFVKHADKKESPAGILNLAYATDLVKDGPVAFSFKIHGHKHTFEAQTLAERDGWFVAVEKAIAEAKEAKEGIESSEAYKEEKTKLGKPTILAAATTAAAAPKKSIDTTKPAETDAPVAEAAGPARAGSSSSSSSSDADKKNKKKAAKSKSRSVSRKRASIFGGLLGKKDKADEHVAEPEVKKEESVAPQIGETSTTAPVITSDIPKTGDELKAEPTPAPVIAETAAPAPVETEAAAPVVAPAPVEKDEKTLEKPKPTKRSSIFGSFFEKVKSPSHEKKEVDLIPAAAPKETTAPEVQKPTEETPAVAPAVETTEAPLTEAKLDAPKTEATKPVTPVKEKEHFSFGKFFGNKEKAKSPAVETAPAVASTEQAPKVDETPAPVVANGVEPVVPVAETSTAEPVVEKKEETPAVPKKEKRSSIFGSLARTVSKAGGKKDTKEKKENVAPATVEESAESTSKVEAPAVAETKEETPIVPAQQTTIGDVTPESVNVAASPANNDGAVDPPVAHLDASNSSSRNLNAPSLRPASAPSSRASFRNLGRSQAAASSSSNAQPASDLRPNRNLTPIPADQRSTLPNTLASSTTAKSRHRVKPLTDSSSQAWTQRRLDQERKDWWDTRVTGSPEVWACLRFATEALQKGDVATAQGLLNAQECTCPDGQLWSAVYDDRGILYKIPEWLIIEPAGLVEEDETVASGTDDKTAVADAADDEALGPDLEYLVRARISSTSQDFQIPVRRRETIASIRETLKTQAKLDMDSKLRLIYGGRMYADHEILDTNGFWKYENDYVLTCYVIPKDYPAT